MIWQAHAVHTSHSVNCIPIGVGEFERGNVLETVRVRLQIVEQDLEVLVVMPVPVREVERVLVVAGLWRAGKRVQGSETKRVRSR